MVIDEKTEGIIKEKGFRKDKSYIFQGNLESENNISIKIDGNLKVAGFIKAGDRLNSDASIEAESIFAKRLLEVKGSLKALGNKERLTSGYIETRRIWVSGDVESEMIKAGIFKTDASVKAEEINANVIVVKGSFDVEKVQTDYMRLFGQSKIGNIYAKQESNEGKEFINEYRNEVLAETQDKNRIDPFQRFF